MIPKDIEKRWYSNPKYYNSDTIRKIEIEDGHTVDIAFIYSGRNRGKSFDISSRALLDAWISRGEEQFGYCRRLKEDLKTYSVESYFDDKVAFLQDISGGAVDGVMCYQQGLYFYKIKYEGGKQTREKLFKVGNTFCLSTANSYKSLQYPKITRLLYEEVFTQDRYVIDEPRKLLNLISTIMRSRNNFTAYLISNTVSRVNPYIDDFSLTKMTRQKPGTIDRYKLYKGTYNEKGEEEYYFIACEYLADADNEKDKSSKSKMGSSVLTNSWDETRLFPLCNPKIIDKYDTQYRCVFQNGAFSFFCTIKSVPINLQDYIEDDSIELSDELMTVAFITRKTTPYRYDVRLYTSEPVVYPLATRGIYTICDLDKLVCRLIELGQAYYSNNLIACEFSQCYKQLKSVSGI